MVRVVTAALVAVAVLEVLAATVAGDFDWAGPRPMSHARARLEDVARDESEKSPLTSELRAGCGPRPNVRANVRCVLVSDPFDLTSTFSSRLHPAGMDDTIDVVIVTRSLNDIDRREPRH